MSGFDDYQAITISESVPLNQTLCFEISDQTKYILSVGIGEKRIDVVEEPLGRKSIITNSTTGNKNYNYKIVYIHTYIHIYIHACVCTTYI